MSTVHLPCARHWAWRWLQWWAESLQHSGESTKLNWLLHYSAVRTMRRREEETQPGYIYYRVEGTGKAPQTELHLSWGLRAEKRFTGWRNSLCQGPEVGGKVRQGENGKQVCMDEESRALGQGVKKGEGGRKTGIIMSFVRPVRERELYPQGKGEERCGQTCLLETSWWTF